jgi:hypothetical protein
MPLAPLTPLNPNPHSRLNRAVSTVRLFAIRRLFPPVIASQRSAIECRHNQETCPDEQGDDRENAMPAIGRLGPSNGVLGFMRGIAMQLSKTRASLALAAASSNPEAPDVMKKMWADSWEPTFKSVADAI